MQDKPMVEIHDVTLSHQSTCIFKHLSLSIPRGRVTAIMGPSGMGKTTLLRLIGGQLQADAGSVHIEGQSLTGLSSKKLYALRKKMGILFQQGALFTDLDVYENLAFPLRVHTQLPESMIRDLVYLKLQAVGLRGAAKLSIAQLSGGMARRVALARAIMLDPKLMMYDEPFTGQDPIGHGVLISLIRSLNDALGLTSVVVTHNMQEVSAVADYMYILMDKKQLIAGTPQQVLACEVPKVKQFIQGLPDGPVAFHYPAPTLEHDLDLPNLGAIK